MRSRYFLLAFFLSFVVTAQDVTNCTENPSPHPRWVPAWVSCWQLVAYAFPMVPAFMIYAQGTYEKTVSDATESQLYAVKIAALGTALGSLLFVVAYLPDCVCKICQSTQENGSCKYCG